ncbi:MAG TPA: adenine phosphoribosyltransferase [Deltaproteobacteria bacterium]|jgi:adenine phosphoribosyltransferase|nr:adenine phosphoribosyltransferase [Deltaproteobacteria bacterium]
MRERQSMAPQEPNLRRFVRDVPDFPKPGILFRDVTPLLANPGAFRAAVDSLAAPFRGDNVDRVLGIESRGFILGAPVALALGAGLVIVRKKGKLPWRTVSASYELEYGTDTVEMHVDAVEAGQRVLVVDDLIATGGTAAAAVRLAQEAKAEVVGCAFLIELKALGGRERLGVKRTHVVLQY